MLTALVQAEARLSVHLAVIILAAHLPAEIKNLHSYPPHTCLRDLELRAPIYPRTPHTLSALELLLSTLKLLLSTLKLLAPIYT